jgi:hypothetical protein
MDNAARLLFRELADLAPAERERLLADRQIAPELRAEVESLLSLDFGEQLLSDWVCIRYRGRDATVRRR